MIPVPAFPENVIREGDWLPENNVDAILEM